MLVDPHAPDIAPSEDENGLAKPFKTRYTAPVRTSCFEPRASIFGVGTFKRNGGYTLLEVLLALSLLAGAGFVMLVKLPVHLQSQRLAQSSTQLLEDLRDARQAALAENTYYQIKFYQAAGFYRVFRQVTRVKDVPLADGVSFLGQPPDLVFNAAGTPSVGMTIILTTTGAGQKKVIVAPVGGRIREE